MSTAAPSASGTTTVSSLLSRLTANRYALPALTVVLGFLLGIGLMAMVTPKPINPATYTKPLQAQQVSLAQQARYGRVMMLNYSLFMAHYNQLVTDANASNTTATEADAVKLATSTQTYINDLKKLTVPACLTATNTALLAGLTDIQQGASALDKDLVANDAGQVSADAKKITDGSSKVTTAENAYATAVC